MTTPAAQPNGATQPNTPPANGATGPQPPAPQEQKTAPDAGAQLKELEIQTKRFAQQQKKLSEEKAALERQRAEISGRSKEFEEWQALRADRKRNPGKYLAADYGDDWYDKLTKYRIEGAPTPDLVASELDDRLKDFQKKLDEKEKSVEQRFQDLQKAENERVIAGLQQETFGYIKSNADKYVFINELRDEGTEQAVWGEIDKHFMETAKKSEDGRGELLTPEKAADIVEARLEKFAAKLLSATQKKKPATPGSPQQPQRSDPIQRRTLSTDMTASSAGGEKEPPKSEKERLQRALAAWGNVEASRQ